MYDMLSILVNANKIFRLEKFKIIWKNYNFIDSLIYLWINFWGILLPRKASLNFVRKPFSFKNVIFSHLQLSPKNFVWKKDQPNWVKWQKSYLGI